MENLEVLVVFPGRDAEEGFGAQGHGLGFLPATSDKHCTAEEALAVAYLGVATVVG